MRARAAWLAGAALAVTVGGCQTEVTVRLLSAPSDGGAPSTTCQKLGAEVCNGGDDDCNGLVDEGCAYTIAWTRAPDGVPIGHAIGGVTFAEPCPDGSVLAGVRVGFGSWLNQVATLCRQVDVVADATQSANTFTATLGPWHDQPLAPAASTDPKNKIEDLSCPDGTLVAAVDGTTTEDTARYILGLRLTCAPLVVTAPAGAPTLDTDRARDQIVGPFVCAPCSTPQATNFTTAIPAGHVATRLFGGDGLWVDRVGFGASLATITSR